MVLMLPQGRRYRQDAMKYHYQEKQQGMTYMTQMTLIWHFSPRDLEQLKLLPFLGHLGSFGSLKAVRYPTRSVQPCVFDAETHVLRVSSPIGVAVRGVRRIALTMWHRRRKDRRSFAATHSVRPLWPRRCESASGGCPPEAPCIGFSRCDFAPPPALAVPRTAG